MSSHNHTSMSRRALLKHLGAGAAALPFLKYARRAEAQATSAPLRLVLWPMMNGADPAFFWPNPGNLSAMSVVTEPLRAFQSQTTFVRGMRIDGSNNHFAVRSMFSGASVPDYLSPDPSNKSLDQLVADHFQATRSTAMKSLHLGAIPADSIEYYQLYGRSTFFFAPNPVDYEANPVTAFDRNFASRSLTGGGRTSASLAAPGKSYETEILDLTTAELEDLAKRVGKSPRELQKIVDHKKAVAALRPTGGGGGGEGGGGGGGEGGGGGGGGGEGGGGPVTPPAGCGTGSIASVEKLRAELQGNARGAYQHRLFSDIMDAQVDIMARALVCGVTRVATLQAGSADGNALVPIDGGYPHHNTSHGDQATFARCQQWYATKMARLLSQLNVPDPLDPSGKTVLFNTAFVVMSECLPQGHGSDDVPCMIIGAAGGKLKTGIYTDVRGASNKQLLKSLGRALGVADSATGHFGGTPLSEILV
jgi:uncharacterized membrane protein YgcG